jgi:hypothetical protein
VRVAPRRSREGVVGKERAPLEVHAATVEGGGRGLAGRHKIETKGNLPFTRR